MFSPRGSPATSASRSARRSPQIAAKDRGRGRPFQQAPCMVASSDTNPLLNSTTLATSVRVAGLTIRWRSPPVDPTAGRLLWRLLDQCVIPAEQRACAHTSPASSDTDIPAAALVTINIQFPVLDHANMSILEPLTTTYAALARSLQVVTIAYNDYDESDALSAFGVLATHFQELSFSECGLTSVRGLEGKCEYLRKVKLWDCKQLSSLDGLAHHMNLQEVHASGSAITSIEPLRTCPALTKVYLWDSQHLTSIAALARHSWLLEVNVSFTGITSIEPLRTCPALTTVDVSNCYDLPANARLPTPANQPVNIIRNY